MSFKSDKQRKAVFAVLAGGKSFKGASTFKPATVAEGRAGLSLPPTTNRWKTPHKAYLGQLRNYLRRKGYTYGSAYYNTPYSMKLTMVHPDVKLAPGEGMQALKAFAAQYLGKGPEPPPMRNSFQSDKAARQFVEHLQHQFPYVHVKGRLKRIGAMNLHVRFKPWHRWG